MRILREFDRAPTSWKNGGGVTYEVVTFPEDAGLSEFEWRISIAEITKAGPFSLFEDVERTLAVLEGELALCFEGGTRTKILHPGHICDFPGNVSVEGKPINGRVCDLNVMVRRSVWRATVSRYHSVCPVADVLVAIATAGTGDINRFDALCLSAGETPPEEFLGLLVAINKVT